LFAGDTIWDMSDSLRPVANFSLQTGDSVFTPYHSVLSSVYPSIIYSSTDCSEKSKFLFFQKGVVVENGIEMENNISYRYYKLKFLSELEEDTIIRKFSERSIITEDYWYYNIVLDNCGLSDIPVFTFLCYKDDFITNPNCQDIEWFESLNTSENQLQLSFKTFPNPVEDILNIKVTYL
jgi:hypothetical protein